VGGAGEQQQLHEGRPLSQQIQRMIEYSFKTAQSKHGLAPGRQLT
jgi:hypothetical protein